jgi:RNA polymerase sigma-32 factor
VLKRLLKMENQEITLSSSHIDQDRGGEGNNKGFALGVPVRNKSVVPYDSLQRYLYEISKYELLTREEEGELARRYKEHYDDEAGHRLVRANLRLVVKIALSFYRFWSQRVLDLIQEGNLGLVQALRKFDPYRGVKFSYYAAFWIRAYMLKFLMENWRLVKIGTTQDQRKLFFRLAKEREKLESRGFDAEPGLLAERLNVKEQEVIEMTQRLARAETSLDVPRGEETQETYGESIPSSNEEIEEKIFEKARMYAFEEKLKDYREALTGRKAFIFDHRIMTEDPLTLEEIGQKYDISRERVRQIESHLIQDIKKQLRRELPEYVQDQA